MSRDAERFLAELDATVARAADAAGGFHEVGVRLAEQDLRLRFAGAALVSAWRPLSSTSESHRLAMPR
jgi:hypothetical protein